MLALTPPGQALIMIYFINTFIRCLEQSTYTHSYLLHLHCSYPDSRLTSSLRHLLFHSYGTVFRRPSVLVVRRHTKCDVFDLIWKSRTKILSKNRTVSSLKFLCNSFLFWTPPVTLSQITVWNSVPRVTHLNYHVTVMTWVVKRFVLRCLYEFK